MSPVEISLLGYFIEAALVAPNFEEFEKAVDRFNIGVSDTYIEATLYIGIIADLTQTNPDKLEQFIKDMMVDDTSEAMNFVGMATNNILAIYEKRA